MDPLAEKYPAWSPYNYTLNNPVNNTDSSGMCPDDDPNCFDSQVVIERKGYSQFRRFLFKAQAFVHGVGNAILDNATPFNFRSPIGHTLYENEPEAYNLGQDVGDSISAVVGTAETVVGVVEAGAGATTTVGSGGTTALVSVPATAQGVALAGHGLSTTLKAIENLIGQNGRVYATYDPSPKHHPNARKGVSDAPTDGQKALDGSVPTGDNSARRVGVNKETGEFNIFNETHRGKEIFHGHQRTWKELDQKQKRALINAGLVNKKGKIQ